MDEVLDQPDDFAEGESPPQPPAGAAVPGRRPRRDPAATLNVALFVYIVVTALFAIPLLIFPGRFFDVIGVDKIIARELDGIRWFGAMLAAWTVSGILVLARPKGRAIFLTTAALQLSAGAAGFVYTWLTDAVLGSKAIHAIGMVILILSAAYLWWARLRSRKVFVAVDA